MHVLCILRITRQIVGTSKKIAWRLRRLAGQHFGALHRTRRLHGSWRQVDGGVQVTAVARGMDPIGRASRAASTRSPRGRAGVGKHEGALCRDVRIVEDARRCCRRAAAPAFPYAGGSQILAPCSSRSNFPVISAAAKRARARFDPASSGRPMAATVSVGRPSRLPRARAAARPALTISSVYERKTRIYLALWESP
jgi:hypothetical protein